MLDLDGVVYRGSNLVPGVSAFLDWLRVRELEFSFLTNRSARTPEEIAEFLNGTGIACTVDQVVTSSLATARYLRRVGARTAFYIGGSGLAEALADAGISISQTDPEFVVVGAKPTVKFQEIAKAVQLILAGATFVATNADRLVNSDAGLVPGNGAIVAAISFATKTAPLIIGKPESEMIEMALERLRLTRNDVILVGDSVETDIRAGAKSGIRTVLLLTGVSDILDSEGESNSKPTWIRHDYSGLRQLVSELIEEVARSSG